MTRMTPPEIFEFLSSGHPNGARGLYQGRRQPTRRSQVWFSADETPESFVIQFTTRVQREGQNLATRQSGRSHRRRFAPAVHIRDRRGDR